MKQPVPIELRKKFELLELLMGRPNRVMSKQQIMDIVWGHGLDANESGSLTITYVDYSEMIDMRKSILTRRGSYTFVNKEDEKRVFM